MIRSYVAPNIDSHVAGSSWRIIWILTRLMKKAGWKFKNAGGLVLKFNRATSPYSLPTGTISTQEGHVSDAGGFKAAGYILVYSNAGWQVVKYTSCDYWSFMGCTGGTGSVARYASIIQPAYATIAAGSNGAALPQATINVDSTAELPPQGVVKVLTSDGLQSVTYAGTSGGNTLTGCSGGTGTMTTGDIVYSEKVTNADPGLDPWGAGIVTNAGAAAASVAAPVRGRALVTGLSGIVAADKGRFLVLSGSVPAANNHHHQIEEVVDATSVRIDARTFSVAEDASGAITWSIKDPEEAYVAGVGAQLGSGGSWWCAEGPAILKIPFGAAPTPGTQDEFVRGETVQQASTGFVGEIVSWTWDGVSSGWLVVSPRVRGTGAGRYGLDEGANPIVGDTSGVSVTSITTPTEWREQVVFWKYIGSTAYGSCASGFFDVVNETAEQFSTLALSGACAAATAPGGGGTGNTFPTHAQVNIGDGYGSHQNWFGNTTYVMGRGFVITMDALESSGQSADGSWVACYANLYTNGSIQNASDFIAYQRLDNTEDGDIYPFTYIWPSYSTVYDYKSSTNRTAARQENIPHSGSLGSYAWGGGNVTYVSLRSWFRRGMPSGESFVIFTHGFLSQFMEGGALAWDRYPLRRFPYYPETTNHGAVTKRVREPLWLVETQSWRKCRKGTTRWVAVVQGGDRFHLSDNKRWIQLACGYGYYQTGEGGLAWPSFIVGGWDGVTVQTAY